MAVKVVDASALAALVFREDEAPQIASRLQGAELVAPALLPFEMANACLKKRRRYPDRRNDLLAALTLQSDLAVTTRDVDHTSVLALAEQTGLTTYDASYLWLARQLGAELVTLDRQLAQAAAALGHA